MIRCPYYGYRRVTAQVRRDGWLINSNVVRRLLHEFGVHARVGRVRWHTTDRPPDHPRYPNLVRALAVVSPDQLWVAASTYVRRGHRCIYLAVILDAVRRAVRGWQLGRSVGQE